MAMPVKRPAEDQGPERLLTYDDYAAMPDDGKRYELLGGRLAVVPAPMTKHQLGSGNLFFVLKQHATEKKLGIVLAAPTDVILTPHDTVQPDVLFVAREHASRITERAVEGAPDLVVEILSESTASRDCIQKRSLYEQSGVPEYWIASPAEKSIRVLVLEGSAYRPFSEAVAGQKVKSKTFPEIELDPATLFDPPTFEE